MNNKQCYHYNWKDHSINNRENVIEETIYGVPSMDADLDNYIAALQAVRDKYPNKKLVICDYYECYGDMEIRIFVLKDDAFKPKKRKS